MQPSTENLLIGCVSNQKILSEKDAKSVTDETESILWVLHSKVPLCIYFSLFGFENTLLGSQFNG